MKKLFIIANWKSNQTIEEAEKWMEGFAGFQLNESTDVKKEVIVCPPFTLLSTVKTLVTEKELPLHIGSQDFSAFDVGAHTGEEPPTLLSKYVNYAIIGHSERRNELGETDELIAKKILSAAKHNIMPILCVQGVETPIPHGVSLVAYEPVFAIGTGHPDTPENAEEVIRTIKEKYDVKYVLYGGSVMPDNVHTFTNMPSIDGVLVGGASLDSQKFAQIIEKA